MSPEPTVSGSSVTSGRCCAKPGLVVASRMMKMATVLSLIEPLSVESKQPAAVEQHRDRAVVEQIDLHVGLEDAGFDRQP